MKEILLFLALIYASSVAQAGTLASTVRVCVTHAHCASHGLQPQKLAAYFGLGKQTVVTKEDMLSWVCFKLQGMYVLSTYSSQAQGRYQPTEIDLSATPQAECRQPQPATKNTQGQVSPLPLGVSEATVLQLLGQPVAIWQGPNTSHDIEAGGRGLVYANSGDRFVLIVVNKGVVTRIVEGDGT